MAANSISRSANRAMTWPAGLAFLTAWVAAAGLSGPFGTMLTQPDLLLRIAHFGICALVGAAAVLLTEAGLARVMRWPGWATLALAALIASIPTTFAVRLSLDLLSPAGSASVGWLTLGAETLGINLVLSFLARRLLGEGFLLRRRLHPVAAPADLAGPMAAFLPPEFRSAHILAIQADDHYLRVHTDRGTTLIHMTIGEAERLLQREDGVRTHRSWWIARAALQSVTRTAGRTTVELRCGIHAPVARARVAAVDAWLAAG